MKTLVIAEKPSLAGEIRSMLEKGKGQKFSKGRDYSESQDYIISSFFGHLLEMAMPEEYGGQYGKWDFSAVPVFPEKYIFKYKKDTAERGKLLAELAGRCGAVMNACDPDREGEGIFRTWVRHENIRKPVTRLWAVSLAYEDLKRSFEQAKPSKDYDRLGTAQACRAMADWLVGMNGTKAYSVAAGERLSIGRVRTATLSLIVERDLEIENFMPSSSYGVQAQWHGLGFTYSLDGETKFPEKSQAEQLLARTSGGEYSLKESKTEEKKKNPPKCFSQPDLQKAANSRFGFSLDRTLKLTQSLYEKKLVTYPRTDSPYLPVSDLEKYRGLALKLCPEDAKELILPAGKKPPTVKNTDASHTAIMPTGRQPESLADDEEKLYNLIKDRFCAAFMKPCIYDETELKISKAGMEEEEFFYSRFKNIKDKGFLSAYEEDKEDGKEEEQAAEGMAVPEAPSPLDSCSLKEIPKTRPKHYTPATLLTAMITCGKKAEGEEKEILAEVEGIGTAATRQTYPAELEANGYIETKKNSLVSTDKGKALIRLLPAELKTPSMTAQWELRLREIERGTEGHGGFVSDLRELVLRTVNDAKNREAALKSEISEASAVFGCPKCKSPVKEHKDFYGCAADREQCGWTAPKTVSGKTISSAVYRELVSGKASKPIRGFKKKDGGTFDAALKLDAELKVKFCFDGGGAYKCPKCGKPARVFEKAVSCSADKEQCGWVLFTTLAGKKLTEAQIKALMEHGRTNLIKGFKSKAGKQFDAALVFDKDKKATFDFPKTKKAAGKKRK